MSILNATPEYRRGSPVVTADELTTTPLIDWHQPGEDLWVGKIGLDHAGMIESVDDRFVVTDWKNERVDVCATLDEAKRSLEPDARVSARARADRANERHQWIASSTFALTVVAVATVGGWLVTSV